MQILGLSVKNPDPFVRFSMMEAIEICGDVFFANTAPIAESLAERHGVSHRYFGQYHRARETGHLQADETVFVGARLSEEQAKAAATVVDCIFDAFVAVLDQNLSFAHRSVSDPIGLAAALDAEHQTALRPPYGGTWPTALEAGAALPTTASPSQLPVLQLLHERLDRIEEHAFLKWLREDDSLPAREKLQSFMALWGVDIVGYKDFNELVLRFPSENSAERRSVNRWTEDLAKHGVLYLQDWQALKMDRVLRWDAGEAIAFYFLSEQTEVHRRNMAKIKQYAFRYEEPVLRWWLLTALEASGDPVFASTRKLAEAAEREHGITLNYWAHRHSLVHVGPEAVLDATFFLAQEISADQRDVVRAMINVVFDNIEEQLTLSHEAATSRVFLQQPASLPPPPRVSAVVLRDSQLPAGLRETG
jgi:hypothetical protein